MMVKMGQNKIVKKQIVLGSVKRHPDGFGFLIPDSKEIVDVYIPRQSMKGVMNQDRVMVEVFSERSGDRLRGEVLKVVERSQKKIVGVLHWLNDKAGIIRDDSHSWGEDLRVQKINGMSAPEGSWVAIEIIHYPGESKAFEGRVVEILGDIQSAVSDVKRIIYQSQIPTDFSPEVKREISGLKPNPIEKDFEGRKDLRSKNLITIDGATAKDFDDAIYVETNSKGFLLYVAIADVSHYVVQGTALDKEAYERGTSIYFPGTVVPMLPEILSNELCSLKPHVPRLCLVAEMQFDFAGEKKSAVFYEGIMESKARVTYGQAQEVVDGATPPELKHVEKNIRACADLAKILMDRRFKNGSLDLDIPESQIILDSSGEPIDVIRSERLFAHRLIEEMMLAANVAVAEFLSSKDIPAIYRIHDSPKPEMLELLENYLRTFGIHLAKGAVQLQKKLTKALEEASHKPEAAVLNILALRTMSQAQYNTDNRGHFGLGFSHYTHFTSPIRRYPDLIVHRLLKNQIMPKSKYRLVPLDELSGMGTWLSACEQRAAKAERLLVSIKKARLMQKHVGEKYEGIISSVTRFGVFVLLRQFEVDGLVRKESLSPESLEFDEDNLRLTAKRSGKSWKLGDLITIMVVDVDLQNGQINFDLPENEGRKQLAKDPRKNVKGSDAKDRFEKRSSTEKDSGRVRQTRFSKRGGKDSAGKVSKQKKAPRRRR